jgi:hypothetical protein
MEKVRGILGVDEFRVFLCDVLRPFLFQLRIDIDVRWATCLDGPWHYGCFMQRIVGFVIPME